MPQGTSLYVRRISKSRHGTPKQFAKHCADHKLGWIALAACWQDVKGGRNTTKMINSADTIGAYAYELEAAGIETWIWGYPWQGREEAFVEKMLGAAPYGRILLDPELGANPTRSSKGTGKVKANEHAAKLVRLFSEDDRVYRLGLSTFGSGWRMGWFPLLAFTEALAEHFFGRSFIGGQTYTDDGLIDRSIADMQTVIHKAGARLLLPGNRQHADGIEVVPNFGTYTWQSPSGKRGPRVKGAKAKAKTPTELRAHLYEFINEGEPIDAVIGWAENFMNPALWNVLAEFADLMERGACEL